LGLTATLPTGSLTAGRCVDSDGDAVAARNYIVRSIDRVRWARGTTDGTGAFQVVGLPPGSYVLEVFVPMNFGNSRVWMSKEMGTLIAGQEDQTFTVAERKKPSK